MRPTPQSLFRGFLTLWLCLGLSQAGASQPPLLWLIEHQGTTSYLFGTIHSGHPELNQLPPQVEQGFLQADRFYAELELTTANLDKTAKLMRLPAGQTLDSLLDRQLQQRINRLLGRLAPGLSLQQFNRLKPWALAMTLSLLEDQLSYGQQPAMDIQLYRRALAANKTVGALEQPEQQLAVFEQLPHRQQLQILEATLTAMESSVGQQQSLLDESYQAYRQGDPDRLESLFDQQLDIDPELRAQIKHRLIDQRNQWMAQRIAEELRRHPGQSLFVAVGAAHFGSSTGVQQRLRQQGYQVRRAAAP